MKTILLISFLLMASTDALPPNSPEIERSVLATILYDAKAAPTLMRLAVDKIESPEAFYDLRHQIIFRALKALLDEGKDIDTVLLFQRLRETNRLGEVGVEYVTNLPEAPHFEAHFESYLASLVQIYVARCTTAFVTEVRTRIEAQNSVTRDQLDAIEQDFAKLRALSDRGADTEPKNIVTAADCDENVRGWWVRHKSEEEPGWQLPFKFPFNLRPHEFTLMTGDSGSGKSSMLGQIGVCLAKQGVRSFVASYEMPVGATYWIMQRQTLGRGRLNLEDPNDLSSYTRSLAFLNRWVQAYNFLGIGDWRTLLDAMHWLRKERQIEVFMVDSAGRLGIDDDDYTTQSIVSAKFANFAVTTGAHVFLVNHENKGDGSVKQKVRGSKKWSDNADNVTAMQRNEQKAVKIGELKEQRRTKDITEEKMNEELAKLKGKWDSKFILAKQRYPGARVQNASRYLFFDHPSLQFHEHQDDTPINYLL